MPVLVLLPYMHDTQNMHIVRELTLAVGTMRNGSVYMLSSNGRMWFSNGVFHIVFIHKCYSYVKG